MRHRQWFFGAASLLAVACGGTDPGDGGSKDLTSSSAEDMATPDLQGDLPPPPPDMADGKPSITVTKAEVPPASGPCLGMAVAKGKGTVTSDVGGINCGASCSAAYTKGQTVTLTAVPEATTSKFSGWDGDCIESKGPTCTVTVNGALKTTATFTRDYFASVQLTDSLTNASSITVWKSPNMMDKLVEVLPGANSTTCLPLLKDETVYVGVKVPANYKLFGDTTCQLPSICTRSIVAGGALIFFRITT